MSEVTEAKQDDVTSKFQNCTYMNLGNLEQESPVVENRDIGIRQSYM